MEIFKFNSKLFFWCLQIITIFNPTVSFNLNPSTIETIDSFVEDELITQIYQNTIPGLGLSIVLGNQTYVQGYGYSDVENSVPVTEQTLFGIGSISKSFAATIIGRKLWELFPEYGEAVLDTPIQKLKPELNFTLIDRFRSEQTTFRDLLSHRTCLMPDTWGLLAGAYSSKEDFMFRMRFAESICGFRTKLNYNNAAVNFAGELIAQITQISYESLLEDYLRQLGMDNTIMIKSSGEHLNNPQLSKSYFIRDGNLVRFHNEIYQGEIAALQNPAGGIFSSPADMMRYLKFQLNLGLLDDQQIISKEILESLRQNAMFLSTAGKDPYNLDYAVGLGLYLGIMDGYEKISHRGSIPPYTNYMSFYPTLGLGIFTTMNGPGTLDPSFGHEKVHETIFAIMRDSQMPDIMGIKNKRPTLENIKSPFQVDASLQPSCEFDINQEQDGQFIGYYGNPSIGGFDIVRKDVGNGTETLYLNFGIMGSGSLIKIEESAQSTKGERTIPIGNGFQNSAFSFRIEFNSDIKDVFYASFGGLPLVTLDFKQEEDQSTATLELPGTPAFIFHANLTADQLPQIPWDPTSCGF